MNEVEIVEYVRQAIWLVIELSFPIMAVGLIVGLVVALFQALTQIQEMTLAFVPKILSIMMAIFFLLPAFAVKMTEFMEVISDKIIAGGLG